MLDFEPYSDVVFSVNPNDSTEVAVSPASLSFGLDNWSKAQTVTVSDVDDEISDGTITSSVIVGINQDETKDSNYDNLSSKNVVVTTADDEGSPTVSLEEGGSILESGETIALKATMNLAAGSSTIVTLTVDGSSTASPDDYKLTSSSITIPAGSKEGTLIIEIEPDNLDEDNETIKLRISNVSGGNGASGSDMATLTINDDDQAGFQITKVSPSNNINEQDNYTFAVQLSSQPSGNVTLSISDNDTSEISVLGSTTLTFDDATWNIPQTVTVSGLDDQEDDGSQTSQVKVSIDTVTTDSDYQTVNYEQTEVITNNVNTAGVTLSKNSASVTEGGGKDTFTVRLNSKPTSSVTMNLSVNGSDEFTVSNNLSFTSGDWSSPKTVTVTGADDDVADGDQTGTLTVSSSSSGDSKYNGLSKTVTVTTTDNDTAGFNLSKVTASVAETGTTDSFSVVLTSEPTATVMLTLSDNDSTEVSATPTTLRSAAATGRPPNGSP